MRQCIYRVVLGSVLGIAGPIGLCVAADDSSHAEAATGQDESPVTVYRVGKVITMDGEDRVINNAVVIVRGQLIETVAKALQIDLPEGATVIEMESCWLAPGMVEGHNHANADSGDLHDYVYLTNPGLRTLDSVDTESPSISRARAGGVTTALLIPGSGTNMSGLGTVVKLSGGTTEDSVMKFPGSLKIAQAGNPERYWYGVGRRLMNYNTRQTLEQAKAYHDRWVAFETGEADEEPLFDPTYDDFRGLFTHEFVASVHTQGYQLLMTSIDMLGRKLDIQTMLDHSTYDGFKSAPLVLEAGGRVTTVNGPRQFYFDRTQRRVYGNAVRWYEGGVPVLGLNTDSPVIPQEELSYQGAMACWYGWEPYQALKGVTLATAQALLIDDRIGSIETGKDADFGIWSGDPIDPRSTCWMTIVNGRIVHDSRDEEHRNF